MPGRLGRQPYEQHDPTRIVVDDHSRKCIIRYISSGITGLVPPGTKPRVGGD
jgi:hypothetical protein